jgi:acetyl-CoA/propionyl-CoA carboxylase, biotin carboxylase, biotin carboxyl carrier protein
VHELSPVLIANRGEIAVRIARTLHRLGLGSVGVFTDADADAVHVDTVDAAVRIASYLSIRDLLQAAQRAGAAAIHPGYGFLSENAMFAAAVIAAGHTWIGPPPQAIELMGDKGRAKQVAAAAGVPVIPAAEREVFPFVVKAVAGGGGKGMRVVRAPGELEAAMAAARREAMAAFGDDRLITERWIERPRHIEVQVLADRRGTILHLGERECSLQRRHQKVVEEAPSPAVSEGLRARLGEAAVTLARVCGYENAGTVEFITTTDASEFFFLEMNTRLQVEHPVTELVYGVDLVELQLRIAAGEPLPLRQEELVPRGHAIEARLYAEDPTNGFLPATGTVRRYCEPPGVRVDAGMREGSRIGTRFDPLLAKVIAHGTTRAEALHRLDRALGELVLLGVTTNAAFTRLLLARPDVSRGEQDTGLLERVLAERAIDHPDDLLPAAALVAAGSARPPGPWRRVFEQGEVRVGNGLVAHDGRQWTAELRVLGPARVAVELDGIVRHYTFATEADAVWIARDGHHLEVRPRRQDRSAPPPPAGSLRAPMPGIVLDVRVANGDWVEEGDPLLVMESMKMELCIAAPCAGVVEALTLRSGDQVSLGQLLVSVSSRVEARS